MQNNLITGASCSLWEANRDKYLIIRLYDVTDSAILIDDHDICDVIQDSLHEKHDPTRSCTISM